MRQISFALTTRQFRERSKRVTRRTGWRHAKARMLLQGVVRSQGLKKGEHVERLGVIRVEHVRRERLDRMVTENTYGLVEVILEGFPELTPREFVSMFCRANGCSPGKIVARIEYSYLEAGGINDGSDS